MTDSMFVAKLCTFEAILCRLGFCSDGFVIREPKHSGVITGSSMLSADCFFESGFDLSLVSHFLQTFSVSFISVLLTF